MFSKLLAIFVVVFVALTSNASATTVTEPQVQLMNTNTWIINDLEQPSKEGGLFDLQVRVTALGDNDIFLPRPSTFETTMYRNGVAYTAGIYQHTSNNTTPDLTLGGWYQIWAGESADFTITAALFPTTSGMYRFETTGLNWSPTSGGTISQILMEGFTTPYLGVRVPEPASFLLAGLAAPLVLRRRARR